MDVKECQAMYTAYSEQALAKLRRWLRSADEAEITMRTDLTALLLESEEDVQGERFLMEAQDELAARRCVNRHRPPAAVM